MPKGQNGLVEIAFSKSQIRAGIQLSVKPLAWHMGRPRFNPSSTKAQVHSGKFF